VNTETLGKVGGEPTHINLNDKTLEGFRHGSEPIFAVQYHPEASPARTMHATSLTASPR